MAKVPLRGQLWLGGRAVGEELANERERRRGLEGSCGVTNPEVVLLLGREVSPAALPVGEGRPQVRAREGGGGGGGWKSLPRGYWGVCVKSCVQWGWRRPLRLSPPPTREL